MPCGYFKHGMLTGEKIGVWCDGNHDIARHVHIVGIDGLKEGQDGMGEETIAEASNTS